MRILPILFTIALASVLGPQLSVAQLAPNTHWIQFTDKHNSPYQIVAPEAFLSQRAIDRRTRYQIAIDSTDLPVNSWYLDSLRQKGAMVYQVSKWLNGAAIYITQADSLAKIYQLPFVDSTESHDPVYAFNAVPLNSSSNFAAIEAISAIDYGSAFNQIDLHHGQMMHQQGYMGDGMYVAIIDAGFQTIDQVPAFDSLFLNQQIIGTWDFVSQDTNVYDDHNHGKSVLSTMAANLPGEFVGTAPHAHYLLLRSENTASEYKIEEINWIAAAEMADSVGVDVVNTSLGYQSYNAPSEPYTWAVLDGQTAPITIGTNMAARKGMLMVTSAGNDGEYAWRKITPPADAELGLSVAACDQNGLYASFSSQGFTADGRIKPDVAAKGQSATIITSTNVVTGNGTSFSSPILAGLATCLWQVDLSKSNFDIMELIHKHSSQYNNPDSLMGYGIPNFANAMNDLLANIETISSPVDLVQSVYPNPFVESISLRFYSKSQQNITIELLSLDGKKVKQMSFPTDSNQLNFIKLSGLEHLNSGVYFLQVHSNQITKNQKLIKM